MVELSPMAALQRQRLYAAEEATIEALGEENSLEVSEVKDFIQSSLSKAGWSGLSAEVVYDVEDDSELSGWADEAGIHLHPRLLDKWKVLHELAHFVDLRDGHGPRFCANFLELIAVGLDQDAAAELQSQFVEHHVEVERARALAMGKRKP